MSDTSPTILWLRRDLRLADHPGWQAALAAGGPVIPVFILDPLAEAMGAAPLWRMGLGLEALAADLATRGSRLILRRGVALPVLEALAAETGARRVVWSRLYDSASRERDAAVKTALKARGIEATSVNGALLREPWTVETGSGGFYKVYTPFWKAVRGLDMPGRIPVPGDLAPPDRWPAGERLADWHLAARMNRGAAVVRRHLDPGEAGAMRRLEAFLDGPIRSYAVARDRTDRPGTSRLSDALATGEISARCLWEQGKSALERATGEAAVSIETWLKELVWREFAYHLLYHTPQIETANWREGWDEFPWRADNPDADLWRRGMTGIEMVDAAMREMYVTGTMHNRCRMLVACVLTKHLLTDWRVGEAWFRECLVDWDPASNAMGWQWSAGSGPDATPYFRVFNPETQARKFDPERIYRDRFLAEGRRRPQADALSFFEAVPRAWDLDPGAPAPEPVIGLKEGRERALAAWETRRGGAA